MVDEREPTKKELLDALNKANALIADLQALQALQAKPTAAPAPVVKVPYQGLVHAKAACFIGSLRKEGESWVHEVDCLWSDDPFEPCIQTGERDDGSAITKRDPNAPKPVPFHLRPRTDAAMAARAATPQTAAEW